MTIRKKADFNSGIIIDLTGPDGNVFYLMGLAQKYAKYLNLDGEQIIKEMESGDYENAVQTFDHYFGEFVILER